MATTWLGCTAEPANKSSAASTGSTYVHNEASTVAGEIIKIQIYTDGSDTDTFEFAVFSKSGNDFTDEHFKGLTVDGNGLCELSILNGDWNEGDLPIEIGEYIGFYSLALDMDGASGPGYYYDSGDQIGDSGASTFALSSGREFQIRAEIEYTSSSSLSSSNSSSSDSSSSLSSSSSSSSSNSSSSLSSESVSSESVSSSSSGSSSSLSSSSLSSSSLSSSSSESSSSSSSPSSSSLSSSSLSSSSSSSSESSSSSLSSSSSSCSSSSSSSCSSSSMDLVTVNNSHPIINYYLDLTGAEDGEDDVRIPIESFQARLRQGEPTYLSVVIPGMDYSTQISARPSGQLVVTMGRTYLGSLYWTREIVRVDLEDIRLDEGSNSQSITLVGHKTETYSNDSITLEGVTYKRSTNGKLVFRTALPDFFMRPGDTVTDGEDTITADLITITVGPENQQMEVSESTASSSSSSESVSSSSSLSSSSLSSGSSSSSSG